MKKILIATWVLIIVASCDRDKSDSMQSPLWIFGNTLSGEYEAVNCGLDGNRLFNCSIWPIEFADAALSGLVSDPLYVSVLDGYLHRKASPEEAFAYERIVGRTESLLSSFMNYRAQIIDEKPFQSLTHALRLSVCMSQENPPSRRINNFLDKGQEKIYLSGFVLATEM